MKCRHCAQTLNNLFLDLGLNPHSNAYLELENEFVKENYFPLRLFVCDNCWLVQTEDFSRRDELFNNDYAYFSSISKSWLKHAVQYSQMITEELKLNKNSFVLEIASNDGYLLKNFLASGIPCVGIEPTNSTAKEAIKLGIPVVTEFFGEKFAQKFILEKQQADLIIGNNVYAHVPDINDFTKGLKTALKPNGTITLEFPHLLNLIDFKQFDTVYHEHYSYLSAYSVSRIFSHAGLRIYKIEELSTHGGSLRIYGCHEESSIPMDKSVENILNKEKEFGLQDLKTYLHFQSKADKVKNNLIEFLTQEKLKGKTVAAYGAAAKGNTLLNYAKIDTDLIPFVCDEAPSKQGKFLPGSHIPILPPSTLFQKKPDWVLILPWNLEKEITEQYSTVKEWGGKFIVAIPELKIIE